jgi:hypothetical protein
MRDQPTSHASGTVQRRCPRSATGAMRMLALVIVACAVAAVGVTPASGNSIPLTGDRLGLLNPEPTTFPANTPFHIEHFAAQCGVEEIAAGCLDAGTHFDFYLDGVLQPSGVDIDLVSHEPLVLRRWNYVNYPAGLPAGTYTFTSYAYFMGALIGSFSRTVTFV